MEHRLSSLCAAQVSRPVFLKLAVPLTGRGDFQVVHLYIRLAGDALAPQRKRDEEEEEMESSRNPAKLLRHCDGIDLKGRLTGNFRGARDSSSSLFVSFLGFGFGFGRFLLRGR